MNITYHCKHRPVRFIDYLSPASRILQLNAALASRFRGPRLRSENCIRQIRVVISFPRAMDPFMSQPAAIADANNTLRLIGPDPQNWVPKRPGIDHNVVVIGGGQSGVAFAFALRRAGIGDVSVLDAAPNESTAGVWLTRARMNRLRTPKSVPGPELGLPGLSFQSWFEATKSADAYAAIERAPRADWAAYLAWLRRVLDIPVRYKTRLLRIEPAADHLRLHLDVNGRQTVETTRKIILANGVAGGGGPYVPAVLTSSLPPQYFAHTSQDIDFAALAGKSLAVIGSAASAFDAAAVALEAGAADVHLFARRASLAALPVIRARIYPGAYDNYHALPDAFRWQQALRFVRAGSTPPADAIERAVKFPNFHLHLGSSWSSARIDGTQIVAAASDGTFRYDFAIAGTGYTVDPAARPEFSEFAHRIARWRDRFTPAAADDHAALAAYPFLGAAHEFLERAPGDAPFLKDIHNFNPSGFVSHGLPVGDILSFKRDIPAIVARISRDLFLADLAAHDDRINSAITEDFGVELYEKVVWQPPASVAAE
jgi:cation diffusion facilitator CzcD-associated flavoprotein CzcO